jgi:hypothetical protein
MDQTASGSMLNKLQLVTDKCGYCEPVRYQVSVIVGEELACIVSSGAYFPWRLVKILLYDAVGDAHRKCLGKSTAGKQLPITV